MAVSCVPNDLAAAAKCYCFDEKTTEAVKIYLLYQIAGSTLTPNQLADAAKCFCSDPKTQMAIQNYLLCQIVNK